MWEPTWYSKITDTKVTYSNDLVGIDIRDLNVASFVNTFVKAYDVQFDWYGEMAYVLTPRVTYRLSENMLGIDYLLAAENKQPSMNITLQRQVIKDFISDYMGERLDDGEFDNNGYLVNKCPRDTHKWLCYRIKSVHVNPNSFFHALNRMRKKIFTNKTFRIQSPDKRAVYEGHLYRLHQTMWNSDEDDGYGDLLTFLFLLAIVVPVVFYSAGRDLGLWGTKDDGKTTSEEKEDAVITKDKEDGSKHQPIGDEMQIERSYPITE